MKVRGFYSFLKAVRGDWRSAIFLNCSRTACPHGQKETCGGFLMAADADGAPILMPVVLFCRLTGEEILPDECLCVLELEDFETVYSLYLKWNINSGSGCAARQLSEHTDSHPLSP